MKICIRADGGCFIGLGHIMRTLVLAKELKKKHDVFYVCRKSSGNALKYLFGEKLIVKNKFKVVTIDEEKFLEEFYKVNADVIITDSYDVDSTYFNSIKNIFSVSGCFDDDNSCEYFNVDFLINQNPHAHELNYRVNKDTKLFLGVPYITLRDEFCIHKKKKINKDVNKILITVGGSDDRNLTELIIEQLLPLNKKLFIIIGPAFKYIDSLKKYESTNIRLCFNADMKYYMELCDIAVASCGNTIYELASTGTPTVGIIVVDNQILSAKKMFELGAIKLSEIDNIKEVVLTMDYPTRKMISQRSADLVDGQGAVRIVNALDL